MALNDIIDGVIAHVLLSVYDDSTGTFPNKKTLAEKTYAEIGALGDNGDPFGAGLFSHMDQINYNAAREKITHASPGERKDILRDSYSLTRGVERFSRTDAPGGSPWEGSVHPSLDATRAIVLGLRSAKA